MWVIIVLASLVVILALVLCIPLDMVLHADVYGRPRFSMRLTWLFGLVSKEITRGKKPEKKKEVVKERRKLREGRRGAGAIFQILRTRGLLKQLKGLLKDILSCSKIRELAADLSLGLGNPTDTGLLFAFIGPANLFLNSYFPCQIRVQPSFEDEATFKGYSYGVARLRPVQLVIPSLRFVFSLAAMRAVKRMVLTKWKRKK